MITKRPWEKKLRFLLFLVVVVFSTLIYRLYTLQILQSQAFVSQSEQNRIRTIPLDARRGNILDKNGVILATSKPVFEVGLDITALKDKDKEKVATQLAKILNDPDITSKDILESITKQKRKYEPMVIKRIPYKEGMGIITKIEENHLELPGVIINEQPMRVYPKGNLAGHIIGTIGKISEKELEKLSTENYSSNDWIGKTGLEKYFEYIEKGTEQQGLRGKKGAQQVEVNVSHRPIKTLNSTPPTPGNNLVLTFDSDLQKTMEDAIRDTVKLVAQTNPKAKAGTGVLIDVKTGAILAMASYPPIDPNDFSMGRYKETQAYYGNTDLKPLLNRAIQSKYPPGSTFKMITGMAALNSGKINPFTTVFDAGQFWLPPYIKCWQVHGTVDLNRALAVSCNTFFQNAGNLAGVNAIAKTANEFGLGKETGITLPGEINGLLPTPEWKKTYYTSYFENIYAGQRKSLEKKYTGLLAAAKTDADKTKINKRWKSESNTLEANYRRDIGWFPKWMPYDTFNMSIGQGNNEYTVLQLANYVATIANGGNHMLPYIVKKIVSPAGKTLVEYKPTILNKVSISQKNLAEIRKGMRAVVEPGGTSSYLFRDFPANVSVAAKTGTAQTGLVGDDKNKDYHGVFVGFAPYDKPQVAYAGIIEYGYHGGSSAGVVAKTVFQKYFNLKSSPIPQLPSGSVE